jgi:hypothetical protein
MNKEYAHKPLKDFDDLKFSYDVACDGFAHMTFDNMTGIHVSLSHRAYYYGIEVGFGDHPRSVAFFSRKEVDDFMPGFSDLHSALHNRIDSVPMPDYPELYEEMHRKVDEALISILMHKMQEIPRLSFEEMEAFPNNKG